MLALLDANTYGGIIKVNDSHSGTAPFLPTHGETGLSGGLFGETYYPLLRATHLQAVAIGTDVDIADALVTVDTGSRPWSGPAAVVTRRHLRYPEIAGVAAGGIPDRVAPQDLRAGILEVVDPPTAARYPPVAVFRDPGPGGTVPDLDFSARASAQRTAAALAAVPTHAGPVERTAALRRASAVADGLVAALSARGAAVVGEDLSAESTSQSFFRVREVDLSDDQAAWHGASVVQRGLRDLCDAPLSGADLAVEVAGMAQAVLDLTGAGSPDGPLGEPFPTAWAAEETSLEERWTARWIVGHQVHVLFNVCAAVAVTDAAHHLRHGATEAALRRLGHATAFVRGFPAAMTHASTIPVEYYAAAVRPSMQPPEVARPLSGRQHRGYKTFRTAMKDLLAVVPQPYGQLAGRDPELAAARDALLEADLIDSERHVTLAYSMVRLRRSIAQLPDGPDNAVGELRLMRHRRAAQYAPLLRFGDHYIAEAVAALRH